MALLQTLKSLLNKLLNKPLSAAAAEDIFGIVGRIITEYEDQAFCSKQLIDRQCRLLDMVLKPEIRLHRSDSLGLPVCKEVVSSEEQPEPILINLDENTETQPLATTSTQPMETQADGGLWSISTPITQKKMRGRTTTSLSNKKAPQRKSRKRNNGEGLTSSSSKEQSLCLDLESPEPTPSSTEVPTEKKRKSGRKWIKMQPIPCNICGESVFDMEMDKHIEEVHVGRKYFKIRCCYCDEGFNFYTKHRIHLLKHLTGELD